MHHFYLMYGKSATVSRKSPLKFALSWSHYLFLMDIQDEHERQFYEIEADDQNWSLAELRRQFNSSLYERLALSRDKKKVRDLGKRGQIVEKPEDLMKDPYVLEFLGLERENPPIPRPIWRRPSSTGSNIFSLNSGKDCCLKPGRNDLPLMTNVPGGSCLLQPHSSLLCTG